MGMTSNDITENFTIYELERIVLGTSSKDERRVVLVNRIAFFNTLENAEEAMRAYILEEKERVGDKLYYDGCQNFQICKKKVLCRPYIDIDVCTEWRSYTSDGVLCKNKMCQF